MIDLFYAWLTEEEYEARVATMRANQTPESTIRYDQQLRRVALWEVQTREALIVVLKKLVDVLDRP